MKTIDKNAKIVVLVSENPRRPGTAAHKRAGVVLRSRGQTVEAALKKGAKLSTVRHLAESKVIRLNVPAKKANASTRRAA